MSRLEGKRIGFGVTASHCTFPEVEAMIQQLVDEGAEVHPVVTYSVVTANTRFGTGEEWIQKIEDLCGRKVVASMADAEPFGPITPLDCMVISPLTGNTLSKLANAQTDSPVLMAAKATLRNRKPVVIGISTNDALGMNGPNVMNVMKSKHMYLVPLGQDDPFKKPTSLVADFSKIADTVVEAIEGRQLQPLFISYV